MLLTQSLQSLSGRIKIFLSIFSLKQGIHKNFELNWSGEEWGPGRQVKPTVFPFYRKQYGAREIFPSLLFHDILGWGWRINILTNKRLSFTDMLGFLYRNGQNFSVISKTSKLLVSHGKIKSRQSKVSAWQISLDGKVVENKCCISLS